ncbi:MAG: aminopeptidase P N-terminal domain-containing protein [Vicinamibacterales bacterium]
MRRVPFGVFCLLALLVGTQVLRGQIPPYGGATDYLRDMAERRDRLARRMGTDSVLVVWSAPPRVYSGDTNYEYRQDSNLLYLTGIEQEDTTLVLVSHGSAPQAYLFVRAPDPLRELWYGHTFTADEMTARSGITAVFPQRRTELFDAFMDGVLGGAAAPPAMLERAIEAARGAGPTKLGILEAVGGDARGAGSGGSDNGRWARSMQQSHAGVSLFSGRDMVESLRAIKTPYEQRVLRRSVEISAEAHIEGMKAARPGRWEYEVEAAIEYWFLEHGALSWGYPSIVGSGPNATTLHYLKSTRQMADGDLVLVDAAGNFQGLTGDITRTYPVNGRYSPAQRELYDLVMRAQDAGIAAARPGSKVSDIERAVRRVVGTGLLSLGLVADPAAATGDSPEVDLWYPHGPTHGIGMDVHDPLDGLDPGAAFVIEPGVYIRPDTLERLQSTPSTRALAARIAPAVERYRNLGVRLEDSFLMTATGPVMLSVKAPRQAAEIEKLVGTGR